VAEIIAGACRDLLDRTGIECLLFGGQISRSFRFMEPALEKGFSGIPSLKAVMPVKNMSGAAFYGILAAAENDEEISPLYLEKDVCVPF
jgi:glucokinase